MVQKMVPGLTDTQTDLGKTFTYNDIETYYFIIIVNLSSNRNN